MCWGATGPAPIRTSNRSFLSLPGRQRLSATYVVLPVPELGSLTSNLCFHADAVALPQKLWEGGGRQKRLCQGMNLLHLLTGAACRQLLFTALYCSLLLTYTYIYFIMHAYTYMHL